MLSHETAKLKSDIFSASSLHSYEQHRLSRGRRAVKIRQQTIRRSDSKVKSTGISRSWLRDSESIRKWTSTDEFIIVYLSAILESRAPLQWCCPLTIIVAIRIFADSPGFVLFMPLLQRSVAGASIGQSRRLCQIRITCIGCKQASVWSVMSSGDFVVILSSWKFCIQTTGRCCFGHVERPIERQAAWSGYRAVARTKATNQPVRH